MRCFEDKCPSGDRQMRKIGVVIPVKSVIRRGKVFGMTYTASL